MRNAVLIFFILLSFLAKSNSSKGDTSKSIKTDISLISQYGDITTLKFSINSFNTSQVKTDRGIANLYSIYEGYFKNEIGQPDLPILSQSIIIPNKSKMQIEVVSSKFYNINNVLIAPSKGFLKRNESPNKIPYVFGRQYKVNEFFPNEITSLDNPYIFRDFRGQTINVCPFQYNPITKELRIYTEIILKVSPTGDIDSNNVLENSSSKPSEQFKDLYKDQFVNYSEPNLKYIPVPEMGDMLIISYGEYIDAMQPFVRWKNEKGIKTDIVNVKDIGDSDDIKDYVSNFYKTKGLTFLLLVGDHEMVPAYFSNYYYSDAKYGHILGNDSYAEVIVGRFSAESISDVETQVERVIAYEKFPIIDDFYKKAVCIASEEGPGDNLEFDYQHMQHIKNDLLNYNYSFVDEFYEGTKSGDDAPGNPNYWMLVTALNEGRGLINYIGHGLLESFVTTDFKTEDIDLLINEYKLPFIFDVACLNGDFIGKTCLAESFLRSTYNDNPTGAIAIVGSTIEQLWKPPMCAQDEMIDVLTESYPNNIKRTFGGIVIDGCMKMNDVYYFDGYETTDTWVIFGDPSMEVRTDIPLLVNAEHNDTIVEGSASFYITSEANGANVCLSKDGEIISKGVISGGFCNLDLSNIKTLGTAILTLTDYNHIPYISDIEITTNSDVWLQSENYKINDSLGNNDSIANLDEIIYISFDIINYGVKNSSSVQATLKCNNDNIQLIDSIINIESIDSIEIKNILSKFSFKVIDTIYTSSEVLFDIEITDATNEIWEYALVTKIQVPDYEISFLGVDDSNGNNNGELDSGENNMLNFCLKNVGGFYDSTKFTISSNNEYVYIDKKELWLSNLSNLDTVIEISINDFTPENSSISFTVKLSSEYYVCSENINLVIGGNIEDWETSGFNNCNWKHGSVPWGIDNQVKYDGKYSAKSGELSEYGGVSELSVNVELPMNDSISFYKKVSCENDLDFPDEYFDYLGFYVDDINLSKWKGIIDWKRESFSLEKGKKKISWKYVKDDYMTVGEDCAWVDNISFPRNSYISSVEKFSTVTDSTLKFNIYPNPAKDYINIEYAMQDTDNVNIEIVNLNGEIVLSVLDSQKSKGTYSLAVNTSNLQSGMYFVKLKSSKNVYVKSVIIL